MMPVKASLHLGIQSDHTCSPKPPFTTALSHKCRSKVEKAFVNDAPTQPCSIDTPLKPLAITQILAMRSTRDKDAQMQMTSL